MLFGQVAKLEQPGIGQIDQERDLAVMFGARFDLQHDFVHAFADRGGADIELHVDLRRGFALIDMRRVRVFERQVFDILRNQVRHRRIIGTVHRACARGDEFVLLGHLYSFSSRIDAARAAFVRIGARA